MNKLLSKLKNNPGLKLLSVLIAIIVWYIVVGYNDPVITKSYSVHINVTNDSYIANGKRSYIIDETYKSVVVYVKANRSILKDISYSDITVEADLTQIVDLNENPAYVPLAPSCPGVDPTDITLSRTTVPITISDIASKEFPVTVSTGNTSPAKDYEVGKTTPSAQKLVISGPESVVNSIDNVVANIDVTGMSSSRSVKSSLKLIDKNQAEISDTIVQDDLTFEGGYPDIDVYVELWKKMTDVRFAVECVGSPREGYVVGDISTVPESITVAGTDEALENLKENGNAITIPVDVEDVSSDIAAELSISDFLPENIMFSENTTDTVNVNISIVSAGSQTVSLDVEKISQSNLADGLVVSYDKTEIPIVVRKDVGYDEDYDVDLKAEDLQAVIDFSGLTEGDHTVQLQLTLPEGYYMDETPEITVHLKKTA
ncbi:MAG TPA: hypothetical protein DCM49_03295 [Lachnospiraceae bacterium]|nr:hypothetical protein [Lachnospiraceae bacterium]